MPSASCLLLLPTAPASFPATDEVDDLNAIAIFERSRGPVYAAYDAVIEFDRDPLGGKVEGFDEFVER